MCDTHLKSINVHVIGGEDDAYEAAALRVGDNGKPRVVISHATVKSFSLFGGAQQK